jgi:hypothetical protein
VGVGVVFSLGQEVRRHQGRVCLVVGDYQDLTGTGDVALICLLDEV